MSVAHPEAVVDRNVSRVLKTLRTQREMSVKELCFASGIAEGTYYRRIKDGGWTASELANLARALGAPEQKFFDDADTLIPGVTPRQESGLSRTTREYVGGNPDDEAPFSTAA